MFWFDIIIFFLFSKDNKIVEHKVFNTIFCSVFFNNSVSFYFMCTLKSFSFIVVILSFSSSCNGQKGRKYIFGAKKVIRSGELLTLTTNIYYGAGMEGEVFCFNPSAKLFNCWFAFQKFVFKQALPFIPNPQRLVTQ